MLQRTYVIFLIMYISYNKTISCFESFYGVKTNEYPKTSCQEIANIKTALRCLGRCGSTIDNIVMISYNESTDTCMCCNDITGSDLIGADWNSFVLVPWSTGCTTYQLTSHQICLMYFPVPARYSTAKTLCQAGGGNLFKIDSQEKFDLFEDYHVPIADGALIEVWIQGEKTGDQWRFDDGTLIPHVCPLVTENKPDEIHLRARGRTGFDCRDAEESVLYHYTCEYQRWNSH
nr:uncharacterized protein LOC105332398 [Crassostrea gigas]